MKNTLKAELHQAFHNRFFYISFFLMLAFSVFGVFFMELPRESGFDLWRQYRFDENGAPLTTLFLPATGLYCKWLGGDAGQFTTAAFYFLVFFSLHGSIFMVSGFRKTERLRKPYDFERR